MLTWPFICKRNAVPVNFAKKGRKKKRRLSGEGEGWTGGEKMLKSLSLCRSACPVVSVDVCCRAHQDLLDLLGRLDLRVLLEFKDHG